MRNKYIEKAMQKGSLMIEALAMLGLIALVTPVVYKKAAERTSEMQDINEAGNLRIYGRALDDFLTDNYDDIIAPGSANPFEIAAASDVEKVLEYLPKGFAPEKSDGSIDADVTKRASKMFQGPKFFVHESAAVKDASGNLIKPKILTGFVVANPNNPNIAPLRSSRIASMVGTNGGYAPTDGTDVRGAQGVWQVAKSDVSATNGAVVVTSMDGITSSTSGDEVLYRVDKGGNKSLNTMVTTLYLGDQDIEGVKQITATRAKITKLGVGVDPNSITDNNSASILGKLSAGSANIADGALKVTPGSTTAGSTTGDVVTVKDGVTVKVGAIPAASDLAGGMSPGSDPAMLVGGGIETDTLYTSTVNTVTLDALTLTGGKASLNDAPTFKAATNRTVTIDKGTLQLTGSNVNSTYFNIDGMNTPAQYENAATSADVGRVAIGKTNEVVVGDDIIGLDAKDVNVVANSFFVGNSDKNKVLTVTGTSTTTTNAGGGESTTNTGTVDVNGVANFKNGDNEILQVGGSVTATSVSTTNPSVYIRDGGIVVSRGGKMYAHQTKFEDGYVQADRFISNTEYKDPYDADKDPKTDDRPTGLDGTTNTTLVTYDKYQVNPAYTSVMHDIKLSTRGGARLSDILPDYINKGVYVLDNSYKANDENNKSWDWTTVETSLGGTTPVYNLVDPLQSCANDPDCETSPWLGFVPAPVCPPGYSRLAYITPLRFNMAKAYGLSFSNGKPAEYSIYAPKELSEDLSFQGGTWLNMSLQANKESLNKGTTFYGWHALMGLIYPAADYAPFIYDKYGSGVLAGVQASCNQDNSNGLKYTTTDGSNATGNCVLWNILPVYNREMSATVNTYCYFDRSKFNPELVDRYNQLTDLRNPDPAIHDKSNDAISGHYYDRLNDPESTGGSTSKYNDPW